MQKAQVAIARPLRVALLAVLLTAVSTWTVATASSATPERLTVQGFLSEAVQLQPMPVNGVVSMTFEVYDAWRGGSLLATHGPVPVLVTDGSYEVELPLGVDQFGGTIAWVQLTVDGELLAPRISLTNAPFTHVAESLAGADEGALAAQLAAAEGEFVAQVVASVGLHAAAQDPHPAYADEMELPTRVDCDGVDDTVRLQQAIAGANEVILPAGATCTVLRTTAEYALQIVKDDFRLRIEAGAVLRLADGQASGEETLRIVQIGSAAAAIHGVTIEGPGTIDGNRANNPLGKDVVMQRRAGVAILGIAEDIEVRGVRFVEASGDAIMIQGNSLENARHIRVRDNRFRNVEEGIIFFMADHVSITGNHIHDVLEQDGIEPHEFSEFWIIADNIISQVAAESGSGINPFAGASDGVIVGNTIVGHVDGIDLQNTDRILVSDNLIRKPGGTNGIGIRVRDVPGVDQRCNIVGNRIEGYHYGLLIESDDVHVSRNYVVGAESHGVYWNLGDRGTITDNFVIDPGGRGIHVADGDGISISGNTIVDSRAVPVMTDGAYFKSTVTGATFVDNEIVGQTFLAVRDDTGGAVLVRENVGFATETRGVASVPSSASIVSVLHGLDSAPGAPHVSVTPAGNLGQATKYWVAAVTDTSFEIHLDADPGAGGVDFSWSAVRD
ncbi:MAG: hypothetical protein GY716_07380 [bacterium]|nr:hypothetical protein [bacterium]